MPGLIDAAMLGLAAICVVGCTTVYQPGVPPITTLDLPVTGSIVVNPPPPPPPIVERRLRVPPSDVPPVPSELTSASGWSGSYAGWASMINAQPGRCAADMRITNFRVTGDQVRFGRFRGRVAPDGRLQLVEGQNTIVGGFRDGHFEGQMSFAASDQAVGCVYLMTLDRRS